MDTNLIPAQQTALEHASPAARQSHQDQLQANREHVEKHRPVPPYIPILTLEQRVQALEAQVKVLSTPAAPAPIAEPTA